MDRLLTARPDDPIVDEVGSPSVGALQDAAAYAGDVGQGLVAALLFAATSASEGTAVRKTTLAALLDAVEESPDGVENYLDVLSRANLSDVLLRMREDGSVYLTDFGFALSDAADPPQLWPAVSQWFTSLVRRKMVEWQMAPDTA